VEKFVIKTGRIVTAVNTVNTVIIVNVVNTVNIEYETNIENIFYNIFKCITITPTLKGKLTST
jgi:hypothetical protein